MARQGCCWRPAGWACIATPPDLLERTARLVAEDGPFVSLVRAIEQLLVLHVSREPLEAHHLAGIIDLAGAAYDRACYLIPGLAGDGGVATRKSARRTNALASGRADAGRRPRAASSAA